MKRTFPCQTDGRQSHILPLLVVLALYLCDLRVFVNGFTFQSSEQGII